MKFLNHVNAAVQDAAAEMEDEDTDTDDEEAGSSVREREKRDEKVGVRRDREANVAERKRNLEMESFLLEARTMASLQHPNVVFIYGMVDDGDRLGIVEEFMSSGSLRRLLNMHARDAERRRESAANSGIAGGDGVVAAGKSSKNTLSARARARCALDVARGMAYLHSKRFVHFDLKCDNVLTARRGARLTCKVCDFGLSKQRGSRATFVSGITSHRGTLPWTAPELLSDPSRASERVDVYSFGVAMWELWTGRYPYADMREQTIMYGIMTGMRPDLPRDPADAAPEPEPEPCPGWRELMTSAWAENPSSRPTFDEVAARLEAMIKAAEKADGEQRGGTNARATAGESKGRKSLRRCTNGRTSKSFVVSTHPTVVSPHCLPHCFTSPCTLPSRRSSAISTARPCPGWTSSTPTLPPLVPPLCSPRRRARRLFSAATP